MALTRKTVQKGAGAVAIRRHSDNRILFLNTNSKYALNKATTEGDKVQGFNSSGVLVDLDVAGQEESYELEVSSRKNTQNMEEMLLDSAYVDDASYDVPWAESGTVASEAITLNGGTPETGTLQVSYLDGKKFTITGGTPATAGTVKDNGDGTLALLLGVPLLLRGR